jgi:hypothetical protein
MAGFGPPPKPVGQGRRPNQSLAGQAQTYLPAEGRQGKVPEWPFGKPAAKELELWKRLWRRPEAVMWERDQDVVAWYVKVAVEAIFNKMARTDALKEKRQLEDRLGLSPQARLRLRWVYEPGGSFGPETSDKVIDVRHRLKADE